MMKNITVKVFSTLIVAASSILFTSALHAQSGPLANQLTGTDATFLGGPIAISGDTVIAGAEYGANDESAVYVFERSPGGWSSETQTAILTPSDAGPNLLGFARFVAISNDIVYAASQGAVYIFAKPAAGWKNMHETAKLTVASDPNPGYFGSHIAVDGDTLVALSPSQIYLFVKPAGGWTDRSGYQGVLQLPSGHIALSPAVSGDTVVLSSINDSGNVWVINSVYVFQKPEAGWAGTQQPVATLTRSPADSHVEVGSSIAIWGDTIAVSAVSPTHNGQPLNNRPVGVVDLFVKPVAGWANATQTVELVAPPTQNALGFGDTLTGHALALDSSHLVIGSSSDTAFVYSKPAAGWGSFEWPSQQITGLAGSAFGVAVALDANTIAVGAPDENQDTGAAYVYTLKANPIHVSTDFIEFPDMNFGSREQFPLTVTNSGTDTLTFATSMDSPNYQVLHTPDNTCSGGVPAEESCVLPIEFNPPGVGQHTNHLILTSPASGALRIVEMRSLAEGVGAANESPLVFDTAVHTSQTGLLVLANFGVAGSPTVALSFSNPDYSLASAGTCAAGVPEGGTCTMTIRFAPLTSGDDNGTITLTPSSGASSKVLLIGTADYVP